MNLKGVAQLSRNPLTGTWFRAIQPHYWQTALATSYTNRVPSRFSDGGKNTLSFQTLYVAENSQVAMFEVEALYGSPVVPGKLISNPSNSWTILNVAVTLQTTVDLAQEVEQAKIETSVQELTGDWRGYEFRSIYTPVQHPFGVPAPTQKLGEALFSAPDIEAFIYVSAKLPYYRNLVVFPEKLQAGSSIVFSYPATGEVFHIP